MTNQAKPLTALALAASDRKILGERIDATILSWVPIARATGHTWAEIGRALGITKQAAQQRYGQ